MEPGSTQEEGRLIRTGDLVDHVLKQVGFGMFQVVVFCLVGVTYIGFSCEVLTFAFISIKAMDEWNLSPLLFSSASAGTFLGNIIGETSFSYIADRYGRYWPYVFSMIVTALLVLGSAFSPNFYTFVVLRILASIGVGGIIVLTIPTLMEFLPVNSRGKVSIMTRMVVAAGSCGTAGMAWWLIPRYKNGWRYFIAFTSIPSFTAAIFRLLFFVESPRYLVNKGKFESAWKIFQLMAALNCRQLNDSISKEEFIAKAGQSLYKKDNTSKQSVLKQFLYILKPPLLRRTICLLLIFSFQISVVNGATLFLPYNLKTLGVDPYVCSFIAFTAEIPGILFFVIIIEWPECGRKNTIRLSAITTAILFFLFAFIQNEVATPVLTVFIYFNLSPIITIMVLYISETYPTEIRVMAFAFIGNFTSILGIGLTFGAGYLAELSKTYTWLSSTVWGVILTAQFIVALCLNHETRGRNLQDGLHETIN